MLPPKDIPPEKLFRLLVLGTDSPHPIDYKIRGTPDLALFVVPLSGLQLRVAMDSPSKELAIIVAALHLEDGPAFSSVQEAGMLDKFESDELSEKVAKKLREISPIYGMSPMSKWEEALKKGAEHPSNLGTSIAMWECADLMLIGDELHRTFRVDRYYGIPVNRLSDGQRMAFSSACKVINGIAKKD